MSPIPEVSLEVLLSGFLVQWQSKLGDLDLSECFVSSCMLWHANARPPAPDCLVLISGPVADNLPTLQKHLSMWEPAGWIMCGWPAGDLEQIDISTAQSLVGITDSPADAVSLIAALARAMNDPHETELRRLTSLQRSFSQALDSADAIGELLRRLHRNTNAVCAVVDAQGRVRENTGALPMSLLIEQVRRTDAPSQRLSAEGWNGQAVRLKEAESAEQEAGGWLVVIARRDDFPTTQNTAAIHIVATLIEAARQMREISLKQQYAIRSAIFDEALALRPNPEFPELASRLSAIGIDFSAPLHVVVATGGRGLGAPARAREQQLLQSFKLTLDSADFSYLSTSRESGGIFLIQAEADSIHRLLRINQHLTDDLTFGIGRPVSAVGHIAQSYDDALLAIRTVHARRHSERHMSFDQFDFATQVFASVGLDTLVESSRQFLAPVLERRPLLEALRQYFEHAQNTNAAAKALGIHHNTLRYRLSKLEESLKVSLNNPAATASLFLAITSLDLLDMHYEPPQDETSREPAIGVTRVEFGQPMNATPQFGALRGSNRPTEL